jgi:hypothetical protein
MYVSACPSAPQHTNVRVKGSELSDGVSLIENV